MSGMIWDLLFSVKSKDLSLPEWDHSAYMIWKDFTLNAHPDKTFPV